MECLALWLSLILLFKTKPQDQNRMKKEQKKTSAFSLLFSVLMLVCRHWEIWINKVRTELQSVVADDFLQLFWLLVVTFSSSSSFI